METVPAGTQLAFEVTYQDSGLPVGMSVYDVTGSSPVLVQGPNAMSNTVNGTYVGKFTPVLNKSYLIFKAVYTDGSFTTLDTDYVAGSETIFAEAGGSSGSDDCGVLIGLVNNPVLLGIVESNNPIVGIVAC
jgi:hypothetical protein